jgi:hypothetical protein
MWEPRRLTTVWASTACCKDSFTLPLLYVYNWDNTNIQVCVVGDEVCSVSLTKRKENLETSQNTKHSEVTNYVIKEKLFTSSTTTPWKCWGMEVQVHTFFILALDGGEWLWLSLFNPGENGPYIRYTWGWACLSVGLDNVKKRKTPSI